MQTGPLPSMLHAQMPLLPCLPEMFRLEGVTDFPVQEAQVMGLAKAAFSVGS
jgi:hypothetical protein